MEDKTFTSNHVRSLINILKCTEIAPLGHLVLGGVFLLDIYILLLVQFATILKF